MAFSDKQRGVLRGILIGGPITIVGIFGSILFGPEVLTADASFAQKVEFFMKSDVVIVLWLGISIGRLAHHRFLTPEDIDGGGLTNATQKARVLQATLLNTLEQTVLAVFAHAIWVVSMPTTWAFTVWVGVAFFILGRILFVSAYDRGAPARAVGFVLTFYPSMLMLLIAVFRFVEDGLIG